MVEPILISIEGNIGSGKSTLFESLKRRHPDWHFIPEPVDKWLLFKNEEGKSMLELFYADRKRWALTFQSLVIVTRREALLSAILSWRANGYPGSNIFISERCAFTDKNVFVENLWAEGYMDSLERSVFTSQYAAVWSDVVKPAGFIYVQTSPEICAERIHGRGRKGENSIPLIYLKDLHRLHDRWLENSHNTLVIKNDEPKSKEPDIFEPRDDEFPFPINSVSDWILTLAERFSGRGPSADGRDHYPCRHLDRISV